MTQKIKVTVSCADIESTPESLAGQYGRRWQILYTTDDYEKVLTDVIEAVIDGRKILQLLIESQDGCFSLQTGIFKDDLDKQNRIRAQAVLLSVAMDNIKELFGLKV